MPAPTPSRAVIYVRISELTDATTSPERQREDCQAYAARSGMTVVDTFEDLDLSGTKDLTKRLGLAAAITAVEEGRADVLIAAKVDRVARSVVTFHEVVRRLADAGGALVSVAEGLDFSTPSGRMVANVLAVFAQFESETIGARVKSAQEHLRREGKWRGGRRPFGWQPSPAPDGKGYVLEHNPEEAPVLLELVQRVLDGEGVYALARDLNDRGILTANGKPWQYQTIRQVLRKRSLIGDHGAERLLDDETFARLQAVLDSDKRREAASHAPALLGTSLAYCGSCNAPMRPRSKGNGTAVYVCTAGNPGPGLPGCWVSARTDHVDAEVERQVLDMMGHLTGVLGIAAEAEVIDLYADERREIEARLTDLEEDRYVRGLFPGPDGAERYARIYSALRTRLDELPGPRLVEGSSPATMTIPTGRTFADLWADADLEERRAMLALVVEHVTVAPGAGGRRFDTGRVAVHPHPYHAEP